MTDHHPTPVTPLPPAPGGYRAHRARRPRAADHTYRVEYTRRPDQTDRPDLEPVVDGPPIRAHGRRAERAVVGVDLHLLDRDVVFSAREKWPYLAPTPHDLSQHVARFGERPECGGPAAARLIDAVAAAGLSGRGGAAFPTAGKLRSAARAVQSVGAAVVIANGAEGEPASVKDAALLQSQPHLVVDGLISAAEAIGASRAVIWLHEGDYASREAVACALRERRLEGLVEPSVQVMTGRDHYLTGESRSVVSGVSGRLPVPYFSRVPSALSGVGGRPTLVQNVETLARLALVARLGPDHARLGPLLSVLGEDRDGDPVLVAREVAHAMTVAEALAPRHGPWEPPQAVLVGGYGGTWLGWAEVAQRSLADLDRRPTSRAVDEATLGPGLLLALPRHACPVAETAAVVAYLAASSAGQCGPCTRGAPAAADLWQRLAQGRAARGGARALEQLVDRIDGRGACALPDAVARMTRSALRTFPDDVARHARGMGCGQENAPTTLPLPTTPGGPTSPLGVLGALGMNGAGSTTGA